MRAVHWHGIAGSQLHLPVFDPVLRLLAVGRVSEHVLFSSFHPPLKNIHVCGLAKRNRMCAL